MIKRGLTINRSQLIVLGLGAACLALLLLFPPFDQYSLANSRVPIFAGFHLFSAPPQYGAVNGPVLLLEVFVVLINVGIAWLVLRPQRVEQLSAADARALVLELRSKRG
jgi:hypothetical protein